jgi:hypothetical protein
MRSPDRVQREGSQHVRRDLKAVTGINKLNRSPRELADSSFAQGVTCPGRVFGIALGYEDLNDHDQIR